jgi:hypothetical protein
MSQIISITPKNWKSFQHYGKRKPAWIKLHRELLNDYAFTLLPVESRALAPMLWLLSSEYEGGKIEATLQEIGFRVHMPADELFHALFPLIEAGFFAASKSLADCYRDASSALATCYAQKRREEDIAKSALTISVGNNTSLANIAKTENSYSYSDRVVGFPIPPRNGGAA